MPYIKEDTRSDLVEGLTFAESPGDLNFLFTTFAVEYIKNNGLSYQTINDVVGALEGAKLEFYRRISAPYENKKVKENGDVY